MTNARAVRALATRTWLLPMAAAIWVLVGSAHASAQAVVAPNSLGLRATYDASASIYWSAAVMDVSSTAHVKNVTSDAVSEITFNLALMRLGDLHLRHITVDGAPATADRSDQSVIVHLPSTLPAGGEADVSIGYRAHFNIDPIGHRYLFMKYHKVITAYRWIPWLSKPQQFDGAPERESWVTGVSSSVQVSLTSDVPLKFATTGEQAGVEGDTQTFTATDVRDFNFSASPLYHVRRVDWNGVMVAVYYINFAPNLLLNWTVAALDRYSTKVGPYAWSTFNVAEIPTGVGMESPTMTWIDSSLPSVQVPYIIVHETGHEWFYAAVGNNQATNPFVDEAMTDFLARDLLKVWQASSCKQMRLDEPVYYYDGCYYQAIYVQGSNYIHTYKQTVGGSLFWQGVGQFYRDYGFKIASTKALWLTIDSVTGYESSLHHDRFPSLF